MSVKSDAETIMELCSKIVEFEILKVAFVANGGVIQAIPGNTDTNVTLTAQQKQAVLAVEAGWQTQVKAITTTWP